MTGCRPAARPAVTTDYVALQGFNHLELNQIAVAASMDIEEEEMNELEMEDMVYTAVFSVYYILSFENLVSHSRIPGNYNILSRTLN